MGWAAAGVGASPSAWLSAPSTWASLPSLASAAPVSGGVGAWGWDLGWVWVMGGKTEFGRDCAENEKTYETTTGKSMSP